jgi:ABC-2 type transport system permease protein
MINPVKHLEIIRLLVGRELTLRYKRSVLGIGWTLLNPILTSFVLWIVFSFVFASRLPSGQQYAPFLMAGILLNTFFQQGLMASAESIAGNGGILTKIYIPPQIFAVSAALAAMVNFLIGFLPLSIVVVISGQNISIWLPVSIVVALFMAIFVAGIGLILSILFIRFDDSRSIVAVLLMITVYLTPIFYPVSILNSTMQNIVRLNPITSYLEIFRWAFSNNASPSGRDWFFMVVTSLASISLGTFFFNKKWPKTVAML